MGNMLKKGSDMAVAVLVVGLLVAFLLPAAISGFNDTQETTIEMEEGTEYHVTSTLNATATNVTEGTEATYELTDSDTGETVTQTVDVGATESVTINDETVDITLDETPTATTAVTTFAYPPDYGWSSGSSSMFGLIPLFLILAVLLYVVKMSRTT